LTDAEKKRDPTRSNDLRRRISTALRKDLALWRSQVYAAVVEADMLGYDIGDVDPEHIDEVVERLDTLLHRQADFAFLPGGDTMDITLRTAYARGVAKAGEEVTPVLPLTGMPEALVTRARGDLDDILEDQIEAALEALRESDAAAAAARSRHRLYGLVLLPLLIRPTAKRLNALATTNVTRAFNAGKLDAYEALGIQTVGVEAETRPQRRRTGARVAVESVQEQTERIRQMFAAEREEVLPEREEPFWEPPEPVLPEGRGWASFYTIETAGDDKVCAICESYEGNAYTLDEARALIPAHPNCRCSIVPLLA